MRQRTACLSASICIVVGILSMASCPAAWAQCVMCSQNAEAAGQASGGMRPLAVAALILLVPTMGIIAAGVVLTWRMRQPAGPAIGLGSRGRQGPLAPER